MFHCSYLQHEYFSSCLVDVKLALVRSVSVNTLTREEVDNVLGSILVSISGSHLEMRELLFR